MTTCTSLHPDLFGFVIARVGRINMLTSHKYTLSQAWTTDYGCSDSRYHFGLSYQKVPSPLLHKPSHY